MTVHAYADLKKQITTTFKEKYSEKLNEIKKRFSDTIGSPRRYEQIEDITDLLQILELRDELTQYKVYPLKTILQYCSGQELLQKKIESYESGCLNIPGTGTNLYEENENIPPLTFSTFNHNPYVSVISEAKRTRIVDTVKNEIGNGWRDLARYLGIQEGVIDRIDEKHRYNPEKVKDMLNRYEKTKADPQRWFFVLCDALERCRRKDLSRSLQETITMNL